MMLSVQFLRQLQQLLYSIGEVEGMTTRAEEHDLLERVARLLSGVPPEGNNGIIPALRRQLEMPDRPSRHESAAHALNGFLDFIDDHSGRFDQAMMDAFRCVAELLTAVYEVTSSREKNLIAELRRRAGLVPNR